MRNRQSVVHLLPAEPFGGLQQIVIELAQAQRAVGRTVNIILLGPSPRVETKCRSAGIDPIVLSGSKVGKIVALRRILRKFDDAILHSHCEPIWATAVLARASNPWIVHLHVYARRDTIRDRLASWIHRHRAKHFVAISQSVADSFLELGVATAEHIDVVHNGLTYAPPAFSPSRSTETFTFGFVGRAVREKGLFDFISVADMVRSDIGIDFAIIGDGEDLAEARATIEKLGLNGRVHVHGFVEDMAPVWAKIDMLAMLSDREPFGLVILEAIASGVAVLGYDTPSGGREIMESIPGCRLVESGSPSALAEAVRAAARDRSTLREQVVHGSARVLDQFSVGRMETNIARVYSRLRDHST